MYKTSRLTGALILLAFFSIIGLVIAYNYFGYLENQKLNKDKNDWRSQSCEDMKKDFDNNQALWKWDALVDKGCFKK